MTPRGAPAAPAPKPVSSSGFCSRPPRRCACCLFGDAADWSYFGNNVAGDRSVAARRRNADCSSGNLRTRTARCRRIDSLRKLDTCGNPWPTYQWRDGAPLAPALGPVYRQRYSAECAARLLREVQATAVRLDAGGRCWRSCSASPAHAGSATTITARPYDTLKTYLLTTSEWKRSFGSSSAGLPGVAAVTRAGWAAARKAKSATTAWIWPRRNSIFTPRDLQQRESFSPRR